MTLDSNLLTVVAIAVGVLGVIATLIAPRLTREARVHAQIFSVDRIRRITEAGDLRIEIHHGADLIDEPVFIVRGTIQNIGGRDLVASHFVDPIRILSDGGTEILSLEVTPPPGVNAVVDKLSSGWGVRWNILKPKERVKFLAVVKASDTEANVRGIRKSINIEARLRDVKTGYGAFSPDIRFGVSLAFILMLIAAGPISYLGMRNIDAFVYLGQDGISRILVPAEGEYRSCRMKSGPLYFSDCEKVRPADVTALLPSIKVERVRVGISPVATIAAAAVSFLYGMMFAFGARDTTAILLRDKMLSSLGRDA